MRLVLQRVRRAAVRVDSEEVSRIDSGLLVLAGVERGDGPEVVPRAADKLLGLRIFDDQQGRMNLSVRDAGGAILLVSQFTLAASTRRGRRPSFDAAAPPADAEPLLEALAERLRQGGVEVAAGRFGAHMEVELTNDGPVTFVLDL